MSHGTVIYIGGFELPDKDAAAHRVYNNAKLFRSLGYKIIFLDIDRSDKVYKGLSNKENRLFEIWSQKYPSSLFSWIKYLTSISNLKGIVNQNEDTELIVCYNYQSIAFLKLLRFAQRKKVKVVADCTEWHEDRRIIKKIDTIIRMKYLHKKTDGVISISSYLDNYYSSFVNTLILPPLIDKGESKWDVANTSINTSMKFINLVYSGKPGVHKDKLNKIIDAIFESNSFDRIKFKIIGITKKEYLNYYPEQKKIINKLNATIIFYGRVSHKMSIAHVKSADFQIFLREDKRVNNAGFPTKFVESMACGTPVITTKTSDLEKYLINGENGYFVNYENNTDLIDLLQKLLNEDKLEINKMSIICNGINDFDYRLHSASSLKFLNQVLN